MTENNESFEDFLDNQKILVQEIFNVGSGLVKTNEMIGKIIRKYETEELYELEKDILKIRNDLMCIFNLAYYPFRKANQILNLTNDK